MIVQIAIGIVLALLILTFLPEILALGLVAFAVVATLIVLAILATGIYFLFATPETSATVSAIAAAAPEIASTAVCVAAIIGAAFYLDAKNPLALQKVKRVTEIACFGLVVLVAAGLL
jgi:hypothetical protein